MRIGSPWWLLTLLALTGCGKSESPQARDPRVTGQEVKDRYAAAAAATRDYVVQGKDDFMASARRQMSALDDKIDVLDRKSANLTDDAKTQAQKALDSLRQERAVLAEKYRDLADSGGDAWEKAKSGFTNAWNHVETAYEKAKSKFE